MDTLSAHHLVSDSRFAEQWVHHRARKYGKNRIAQELRIKGVSSEETAAALENLPEEYHPVIRAALNAYTKDMPGDFSYDLHLPVSGI